MPKTREYEIEPAPECSNPNHGYFIRHGVPCSCAIQPGIPPRIRPRTYQSDALGAVTIPED